MHPFSGFRIVHEFLDDRVPHHRTLQFVGDVAQIADRAGTMSHFHRNVRIDPRTHRVDKGLVVPDFRLVRHAAVLLFLGLRHEFRVGSEEFAAAHLDPAVVAVNFESLLASVELLFGNGRSVVVFISQVIVIAVSGGNNLDRAVAVLACAMSNMCAPQSVIRPPPMP